MRCFSLNLWLGGEYSFIYSDLKNFQVTFYYDLEFIVEIWDFYLCLIILSDVSDINDIRLKQRNTTLIVGVGILGSDARLISVSACIMTVNRSATAGKSQTSQKKIFVEFNCGLSFINSSTNVDVTEFNFLFFDY